MKLIKPSFEIYEQGPGLEGIYEAIETAGRTCYKSTRPEGQTAKDFVDRMIASKHYAMLEHGTVYLLVPFNTHVHKYRMNKYSKVIDIPKSQMGDKSAVTTNLRALVENGWLDDLQYICEPTEFHEKRVTVRFTTDRGVSHEFVRHRVFSFAQESTRYCNYSKDKFGNELTFIIPTWIDLEEGDWAVGHSFMDSYFYHRRGNDEFIYPDTEQKTDNLDFLQVLQSDERRYLKLIKRGKTPQQARQVLPNALKTELVMTGFVSDWQHFFRLRTSILAETGMPHPDASALADPLYKEFIKRGYLEEV